ncbi:hypothetical protein Tco_0197840 [Tanacetum coccineum]
MKFFIQIASFESLQAVIYPDSHVESAILSCFELSMSPLPHSLSNDLRQDSANVDSPCSKQMRHQALVHVMAYMIDPTAEAYGT